MFMTMLGTDMHNAKMHSHGLNRHKAVPVETVVTSFLEICKMLAPTHIRKWFAEGNYRSALQLKAMLSALSSMEKSYDAKFEKILGPINTVFRDRPRDILARFDVKKENVGESQDNIIKLHYLQKHYPDLSLLVQASPGFCCASIVTEAMAREIERKLGIPILSITYDGTGGQKNESLIPYLVFSRKKDKVSQANLAKTEILR